MALHLKKGKDGEGMACRFMVMKGYHIHFCNWRSGHHEIDIVTSKENVVHFIEVKTRHGLSFGYPEEAVSARKLGNLKKAATAFLQKYPACKKIQFDILAITRIKGRPPEFFLIEDVW